MRSRSASRRSPMHWRDATAVTAATASAPGRSRCSVAIRVRWCWRWSRSASASNRRCGCGRPSRSRPAIALQVAVIGLVVNLLSAWLLHGGAGRARAWRTRARAGMGMGTATVTGIGMASRPRSRSRSWRRPAHHGHTTAARRASAPHRMQPDAAGRRRARRQPAGRLPVHVLTDALTSVLAIVALVAGAVARLVVARPGGRAARRGGDRDLGDRPAARDRRRCCSTAKWTCRWRRTIRSTIESDGDAKVADLHVWRVGRAEIRRDRLAGCRPPAGARGLPRAAGDLSANWCTCRSRSIAARRGR